jgi:DNA-binding beta-propeller fold protein YncE
MSKVLPAFCAIVAASLIAGCSPRAGNPRVETQTVTGIELVKLVGPDIGSERPLSSPRDIAINQKGELFIADYGNDRVVKLDTNFALIGEYGGFGGANASLNGPLSIALDNASNLYIVDSGNSRIVRLDSRLNYIAAQSGFFKETQYFFDRPLCVALSTRGDIYIGDNGLGDCYKLDPFFNYTFDFGARNSTSGAGCPSAIAIGNGNQIYVADSDNGRVMVFDDFGVLNRSIGQGTLQKPAAIRVDGGGRIWVTDSKSRQLLCFNNRGALLYGWPADNPAPLNNPAGFCFTADGLIYLLDSAANRILILKPKIGN